jgi:putative ATPase
MVHAGEDPKFIFRRMIIAASEDVGLADPNVLNQVMAAAQAFDYVGMPEGQFHLTQACLIISNAPKSNSTLGYFDALRSVKKAEASKDDVPQHLKDGNRDGADLGHGKGYKYPHAFENHWVAQQYLPEGMRGKVFYHPSREGHEKQVQLQTEARREATWASFSESSAHHSAYASEESSPGDWEQRGIDSQAENMLLIKKLNMELANLGRDDLVLDYHSQSGYLSFEACRISSGAGVHSIAWKLDQYEQLQHLCKDRDVFQRPQIHDAHHHNIGEDLPSLKQLRFDVIFLRQCMDEVLPQTLFKNLKEHLAEGGRIITCHYLLHKEQRLWNGLSQGSFHSSDDDLYKELEEEYYDSEHFKSHLRDHMFLESFEGIRRDHILEKKITFKRKFHPNVIEKWFDVSSPFGAFLERNAGKKTRLDMANQALQNLQFRTVDWTRHLHLGRYLKD